MKRLLFLTGSVLLGVFGTAARAQSHHSHQGEDHGSSGSIMHSHSHWYYPGGRWWGVPTGGIVFPITTYISFAPIVAVPVLMPDQGALAGPMPALRLGDLGPNPPRARSTRNDPERAKKLTIIGDRLFRVGNTKRAAERYQQAARADLRAAAPRVRLAQVELLKGHFAEAAEQVRAAHSAEPDWLFAAPDIEAIYAEPGDFAKQIAKLESHLQAHPHDRDAWLVLGAQWYLSGRTRQAADVFARLSDREPDATLAAFIEVSTPRKPDQN